MIAAPRFATTTWVLVLYAAALAGSGLHHHASEALARSQAGPTQQTLDSGKTETDFCDDADSCTICAAVQQAKALPPPSIDIQCSDTIQEAIAPHESLDPISFRATNHARAPPSL